MNSLLANERKNSVGADYVHSQINPAMAVGADLSRPPPIYRPHHSRHGSYL